MAKQTVEAPVGFSAQEIARKVISREQIIRSSRGKSFHGVMHVGQNAARWKRYIGMMPYRRHF